VPQTSNLKRGWSQGLGCAAGSWLAAKGATHWHRETTIFFNCVISNTNPSQASETAAPFKLASQQSPPAQSQPASSACHSGHCTEDGKWPLWHTHITGRAAHCDGGGMWPKMERRRASETHSAARALGCSSQTGEGVPEAPDSRNVGGKRARQFLAAAYTLHSQSDRCELRAHVLQAVAYYCAAAEDRLADPSLISASECVSEAGLSWLQSIAWARTS
jgi:hypothetical protein